MTDDRRLELLTATFGVFAIAALSWPIAAALILAIGLPGMWRYGLRSSRRRGNAFVTMTLVSIALFTVTGVQKANAKMPPALSAQARHLATHGGIICQTPGVGKECATPRMRALSRQLVIARFKPAGKTAVTVALCIVGRESGFNPGARSTTRDHGLPQANEIHTWIDWSRIYDPVYALGVMWRLSNGGTNWHPWDSGTHPCF